MERKNQLEFRGTGSALFGLTIVNTILTVITLGFYYPWAKVKYLKYYYQNCFLSGDHFSFHGTGGEIFRGFLRAILFIVAIVAVMMILAAIKLQTLGMLLYLLGILLIIPIAIHGTMRYRLAKTSWRSIRFGYRGNLTELIKLYLKGFALTLVTLGIYGHWFEMKFRAYLFGNMRLGNVAFGFDGKGLDYFLLNLKGALLTIFTLGIYSFWYMAELFNFYYRHTTVEHNGQVYKAGANFSAGKVFRLQLGNVLLIVLTLGLGFAWAQVRIMRFLADNIVLPEELDADSIVQTEEDYKDATGEGMFDFLDFNFIF